MDAGSTGLLISCLILVALSAFFSATETAFSSLNRIRLKNMASEGSKKAQRALLLVENYDKLLSSILIGNNIVNILGASLATVLFTRLMPTQQELAVTLSTIVMTVVVLIFGEISPKSLAKEAPESFACAVSGILYLLCVIFTPLTWLFAQWKKLLVLIFKTKKQTSFSEAELITIVDEATGDGGLNEDESELIRSAIEFNDLTVREIYTPRVDLVAASLTASKEELRQIYIDNGFSRIPIYDTVIDNIVGVLHEKDFYTAYFDENMDISKLMTNIVCVTLSANISTVLKTLQKSKTHLAVVIDEYGGTAGIVTLEDILEELVGEIWDEHDEVSEDIVKKPEGDNEFIVKGNCSIEDMLEFFEQKFDADDLEITTVSGWVIEMLGKVPEEGEQFDFNNLHVTIYKTDYRRVESVIIKVDKQEEHEDNDSLLDKLFRKDKDDRDNKDSSENNED